MRKTSVCSSPVQDLPFRISAPRSCSRKICARSLYEDFLRKMSVSGCLYQEPLGPLVQDHCMRISCARHLCQNLLTRILYRQDLCMRISCARYLCQDLLSKTTCARSLNADLLCISLCQDLCLRILYDHLCKISVWGSLAQDLCARIFAPGSCRTSCARSLY